MSKNISFAVAAFLLYTGIIGFHNIGPYNILRWITFIYCGIAAFLWYERKSLFTWIFSIMAIVINPIIKIRMSRGDWQVIDIIYAIIILAITVYEMRNKKDRP